jgi:hypothetical protein
MSSPCRSLGEAGRGSWGCRIGHPRCVSWAYSWISPPSQLRCWRRRSGGDVCWGSGLSGVAGGNQYVVIGVVGVSGCRGTARVIVGPVCPSERRAEGWSSRTWVAASTLGGPGPWLQSGGDGPHPRGSVDQEGTDVRQWDAQRLHHVPERTPCRHTALDGLSSATARHMIMPCRLGTPIRQLRGTGPLWEPHRLSADPAGWLTDLLQQARARQRPEQARQRGGSIELGRSVSVFV